MAQRQCARARSHRAASRGPRRGYRRFRRDREQQKLLRAGLLALGISALAGLALSAALSRWVNAPLARLKGAVDAIGAGHFETRLAITTHDEFGEVGAAINGMAGALREREMLKGALTRYVSQHVAESIVSENRLPDLRGEKRRITVLFCDIRNFTRFANSLPPEEVFSFLNEYFAEMISVIFEHGGTLDKLIGDGLMALFGAPLDDPEHERHALEAALEMQERLARLREKWRESGRADIACGVGLHTGEAIVGNVGSEQRMDYTAIGDTVNIASRIEAATKEYDCNILLSGATAEALEGSFSLRKIAEIAARGVAQPVPIFTIPTKGSQ